MIPAALRERAQWLIWKFERKAGQEKLAKVPYYVDGGRRVGKQGDEKDRRRLATYEAAVKVAPADGKGGVGFAFLPGDGLIGIDLDGMIDLETGEISERGRNIIKACASFTEYSPSGKGVHIYVLGDIPKSFKSNDVGIEVFCGAQFFTVTGRHYAGTPEQVNAIDELTLRRLFKTVKGARQKGGGGEAAPAAHPASDDFRRVNDAAMRALHAWVPALFPSAKPYQDGYRVGSRDLGRELQEDLSIMPGGIVDWGVNDLGDPKEGRRTPIDLVMEWSSAKKPLEALQWLADKLGIVLERGRRSGKGRGASGPPPAQGDEGGGASDGRPTIKWTQGKLPECVDQAEDALLRAGIRIYQRAGYLVRVVRRDMPSVRNYQRPPGALGIVTVDAPFLIESFTRAARWLKFSSQKKDWVPTNAPEQSATTYIARRGHWMLPRLWSAISAPTLRPDGTLLQEPGYDRATQSWFDPCGVEFPKVPDSPTLEDARAALEKLEKAFSTFPFDNKVDKSVALALVLTALVRRSLPSAPMGVITAPIMASGKTLLADCIAIIATGVSAPAMKYADTDEETTKTMLAVLAEGDQVVLIDNVERPLEGDTLCAILTSESYRQRVLGRTEMMSVPTTTLFIATGNHIVIAGDLRTRALLCRIDPKVERPEERQFGTELRTWMTERRPELVAAGLTIMRAFIATGQQVGDFCKTWGRFERWSDMVRAPLIWLGCEDPCLTLKALEREDPDRIELQRMVALWHAVFKPAAGEKDPGHTAREAIDAAMAGYNSPEGINPEGAALYAALKEICRDRDGSLSGRRLAKWLNKHSDRLVDGKRFVRLGEKDHTLLWGVEFVN